MNRPKSITSRLLAQVRERLVAGSALRRNLPVWGRIHVDRQLPFLWVYRRPVRRPDPGTWGFLRSEASYLLAAGARSQSTGLSSLVHTVVETLKPEFGSFLIIEVWTRQARAETEKLLLEPAFRLRPLSGTGIDRTTAVLEDQLRKVRVSKLAARVATTPTRSPHAPGFSPLISRPELERMGASWLGVEIDPIWRRSDEQIFPLVRRALGRQFARASKRALFEFVRDRTSHRPRHYHALGRRAVVKAVWTIDRALAAVGDSFDFLLQMTPINADAAFRRFERSRWQKAPTFLYRPRPADPAVLKRQLFAVNIDRIEDPTLAALFREKQRELDLQVGLLMDRDSRRVLYGSLQLYGPVSDELHRLAKDLLERIPPRAREGPGRERVPATELAQRAREEIESYREQCSEVASRVELRPDVLGLIVSRGNLLVGSRAEFPASRVEALLQHEVGTHVLTYLNGTRQPFQQLRAGLAGYEELQEGLAVLAEYLVGGLSRPRLRLLAARVVAARAAVEGASFIETFRLLDDDYGFERRTAFNVTLRIYRGGGLVKDAIYLRGLVQVLSYLGNGGELEPLWVGKIAAEHVPVVLELQRRRVLKPATLRPRYLDRPEPLARLERVRRGLRVTDLLSGFGRRRA